MLNDLHLGRFIYEQPAVGDVEYIFKQALAQEVAYNPVLMERRRILHGCTCGAIETFYGVYLNDDLAELPHHFARSANVNKAVQLPALVGRQSFDRFAYKECEAQSKKSLELIRTLPTRGA